MLIHKLSPGCLVIQPARSSAPGPCRRQTSLQSSTLAATTWRRFPFLRAETNEEPPVASAIRTALARDVERDDAPPVVESYAIDKGNDCGHDLFAADAHQLLLQVLAVFDAFDAQLIVYSENN